MIGESDKVPEHNALRRIQIDVMNEIIQLKEKDKN